MKEKQTAIVLAAGQGKRMGSKVAKQFLQLEDRPVLFYALECFEKAECIDEIIIVTEEKSIEYCKTQIAEQYGLKKVTKIVAGGKERFDSVYQGLLACEDTAYVYLHDGARPFVSEDIIKRADEAVRRYGACCVAVPSKDTVKIAAEDGFIASTPKRSCVWSAQTPQVFSYPQIRKAHERFRLEGMEGITDDAMLIERMGEMRVKLVEGSYENIKITTPEDLILAEKILRWRKNQ